MIKINSRKEVKNMKKVYCVDLQVTVKEGEAKEHGYKNDKEYIREELFENLPFYGLDVSRLFGGDITA